MTFHGWKKTPKAKDGSSLLKISLCRWTFPLLVFSVPNAHCVIYTLLKLMWKYNFLGSNNEARIFLNCSSHLRLTISFFESLCLAAKAQKSFDYQSFELFALLLQFTDFILCVHKNKFFNPLIMNTKQQIPPICKNRLKPSTLKSSNQHEKSIYLSVFFFPALKDSIICMDAQHRAGPTHRCKHHIQCDVRYHRLFLSGVWHTNR